MASNPIESFKTHSNYIRAFATLIGSDTRVASVPSYAALARKAIESGCLPNGPKFPVDSDQVLTSLRNAWGTECLMNMGAHFIDEPELTSLSNNWSAVQTYYVLYHSTQALAVAKGYKRQTSHSKTQRTFHSLWADRNTCLEPWTLSYGADGVRNIPGDINLDDGIHSWTSCTSDTAWSLACKALRTTRDEKFPYALDNARNKKKTEKLRILQQETTARVKQGKRPKKTPSLTRVTLSRTEKLQVHQKLPPTTIIDYLYRLRIRSNYVDSNMFTDGPQNDSASPQVRDDFNTIAGGSLLIVELAVGNIVGHDLLLNCMKEWVSTNASNYDILAICHRLQTYAAL